MTNMLLNNQKSNQEKEARALTEQVLKKEEEVFNTDISLFANMVPIPYDTQQSIEENKLTTVNTTYCRGAMWCV